MVNDFRSKYGAKIDDLWVMHQYYPDGSVEKQKVLIEIADWMIIFDCLHIEKNKDLKKITYEEVHIALSKFFGILSKCEKIIETRVNNHFLSREVLQSKVRWDFFECHPPFFRVFEEIKKLVALILKSLVSTKVITNGNKRNLNSKNYPRHISLGFSVYQITPTAPPFAI